MQLSDFDFDLPESHIALEPLPRGQAKLLYVQKKLPFMDMRVSKFPSLLRKNDLIIFNDTKVLPARLKGLVDGTRSAEITLHKNISNADNKIVWAAFCKPAKKFSIDSTFNISEDFSAKVIQINEGGEIYFQFNYPQNVFLKKLTEFGLMPLPPYISKKRKENETDEQTYQTVFADPSKQASVAAPTAGLHFTDEHLEEIRSKGAEIGFVTLNVGGGTFLPVKTENITEHKMHSEFYQISKELIEKIRAVKRVGGRIIAVGTTSLRVLESVGAAIMDHSSPAEDISGDTQIFIHPTSDSPTHEFKVCDCLFTNFHLPKSTLFMLISSISGVDESKRAYKHAIENNYRFFSYGDACFFEIS